MVTRIKLILSQDEYAALVEIASKELRTPDSQAVFILRKELERQSLLVPETAVSTDSHIEGVQHANNPG